MADFAGGGSLRRGVVVRSDPDPGAAILCGLGWFVVRKAESFSQEIAKITKTFAKAKNWCTGGAS